MIKHRCRVMTLKFFRSLGRRDFENGAVLDEIERVIKHRDKLRTALAATLACSLLPHDVSGQQMIKDARDVLSETEPTE